MPSSSGWPCMKYSPPWPTCRKRSAPRSATTLAVTPITMFWQVMGGKGGEPGGDLAAAVVRDFGSLAKLQADFNQPAARGFGSGWAMVLVDSDGKLSLVSKPNQDAPITDGHDVLFGNDVWEHAYYLKYQNRQG